MKHYALLYQAFFATCVAEALSFRLHFILLIVVDLIFYASSIATVMFLFDHVDTIGVWNRKQFLFFICFNLAVNQLHMSLFAMSFWEFSSDLRLGRLDFWLVKPASLIFSVFFRHIRLASLLLFPIPWGGLIYYGMEIGLTVSEWALLPLFVFLGITLITSIEILFSSLMFLTIESIGINFVRMQLQSLGRWPDFIYPYLFQKTFTFLVPILLVTSAPVHILLGTGPFSFLLSICAALLIIWCLIAIAYRIGLKFYESASS